jgi:UDP-N-acetyl-D-mannosaminuronic acid transferase (WecB/TagA/CpsF family)
MTANDSMSARKSSPSSYEKILGIPFFIGTVDEAVRIGLEGGLVVVPSAPVLVGLATDEFHREALLNADLAITDSGLMVLVWRLLSEKSIPRVSGLKYLKHLLNEQALHPRDSVLWIMPNAAARDQNLAWLRSQGHDFAVEDCYIAPHYGSGRIHDEALVKLAAARKPRHIVVCIGGGTQERLGLMLKRECDFQPSIHCLGAAIGFLTGDQVRIPEWADKWYLGWLFRCVFEPGKFVPRYWKARKLVPMMIRYRERAPLMATRKIS